MFFFFFSSRRRHTRFDCDWSSDVCSSDLMDRDAKNVRLTPAGEAFLVEARKVLAQLQHAADVVRGVAEGMQGRLDVGITGSMVYRQVPDFCRAFRAERDRKSTRLNSSHSQISYAVFCLKKKN